MTQAVAPGAQIVSIALTALRPHPSNRKHFDKKKLAELVENVRKVGILTPLLVRIHSTAQETTYQIVAGERRWRAADEAGLDAVPCVVRALTDDEALEILITENLQREDPHPLEEADTYAAWLERPGHDVAGLAAKVNKSATYVYSRLQLRRLGKEARKAFWDGKIPIGHAQVIARLEEKDQGKALDECHVNGDLHGWLRPLNDFMSCLVKYDLELKDAPFPLADAGLCPKAGSCQACPKRTGFKDGMFPELATALKQTEDQDGITDTCLDEVCFKEKEIAFVARQLQETKEAHGSVLRLSTRSSDRWPSSSSAAIPFGVWKVAKKGAAGAVPGVIVSDQGMGHSITPKAKLGMVYWVTLKAKPTAAATAAKKDKGEAKAAANQAERIKELRKDEYLRARGLAGAKALLAAVPEKLDLAIVRWFLARLDEWTRNRSLEALGIKRIAAEKATPAQLHQLMLAEFLEEVLEGWDKSDKDLIAFGQLVGVDAKKVLAVWEKQPHPGTCSKCHCTETTACEVDGKPCSWANKEQTLCTACQKPAAAKPAKKGGKK